MDSYTTHYTTRFNVYMDRQHLNTDLCPESRRKLNRGGLTIDHIYGATLLTCTGTWGGGFRGTVNLPSL